MSGFASLIALQVMFCETRLTGKVLCNNKACSCKRRTDKASETLDDGVFAQSVGVERRKNFDVAQG